MVQKVTGRKQLRGGAAQECPLGAVMDWHRQPGYSAEDIMNTPPVSAALWDTRRSHSGALEIQ